MNAAHIFVQKWSRILPKFPTFKYRPIGLNFQSVVDLLMKNRTRAQLHSQNNFLTFFQTFVTNSHWHSVALPGAGSHQREVHFSIKKTVGSFVSNDVHI